MATKSEAFFHDKWLGHVQTASDGLVVAKPVLLEAGCAQHQPPEVQETLRELCPPGPDDAPRHITDLMQFFQRLLDFDLDLFDAQSAIPDAVALYAPEGPQTIRPTFGLLRQDDPEPPEGAGSPAANAAARYVALLWDVTELEDGHHSDAIGLPLDKPETTTGSWSYPAAAKFDRLLRHCRVPIGILTNREVIRLVYAPHGESSGHITFRIDDMATVGGRPILDAMIMLLCANQWFGVSDENALPALLRRSREYQGTVTKDLAEQVFSGLEVLLKGFQTAAERDKSGLLSEALERDRDHLYCGLLTVMLRLVFILYAEDRGLLPVDHPLYAQRMSLLGLFERLQRDQGNFPDSMNNRFGAWGHIISLSRTIYLGAEHGDFRIPPRQGDLFDPHGYPFLEGWTGSNAPIISQKARAEVKVPTVDDGTVFVLLRSLLIFQGQRLSYRTLDVEQIGSVYESLMGYHVCACESPAVAIKINGKRGAAKFWLEPKAVLERPAGQRVKWLQNECGFDKPVATKIKKALDGFASNAEDQGAAFESLLPLAAGKKGLAHEQRASAGQYVLQPGSERRRSGTQYTPRSLTEPIVRKTLEPLIRCLGEAPTAEQLLQLKICDPAMGSGAFLVECCRQLADAVVAAWARAGEIETIAASCPGGDVVAHARRLVAQRCLYGVDKNPMAVQLAKLSLWLFTLARDLPFTFLDHSFRHGDSLVGLDLEQIKAFHWKPNKQLSFLGLEIKRVFDEVVVIRQQIHQLADNETPEGQKLKAQKLFDAEDSTEKLRRVADICVGAFFAESTERGRLNQRQVREDFVRVWLETGVDAKGAMDKWSSEIRSQHFPFHWWLEFPEVFNSEKSSLITHDQVNHSEDMDGFVGNPPFGGTSTIAASSGSDYFKWLTTTFTGDTGVRGKCDLCAFFFRRACQLLGDHGALGMVATNTISQGDTRSIGLKHILAKGFRIHFALPNMAWPGDAAVVVSLVGLVKGKYDTNNLSVFEGKTVEAINSRLRPKPERPDPSKLNVNEGHAFVGSMVYGDGFELTLLERDRLIESNPNCHELIFPYLGGEEVNTCASQSFRRYVINFGEMSLEEARAWPDLMGIVEERVKPYRENLKENSSTISSFKRYWWRHGNPRSESYRVNRRRKRCLVSARVSKHLMFSFQPTDRLFSEQLYVFSLDTYTAFAVLQSRVHEVWARLLSSTMGEAGLRYGLRNCFYTFPFPAKDIRESISVAEAIGERVYEARALFMNESNMGLTDTYNLIKDPECSDKSILHLRLLHESMDRAIIDAYRWGDIEVPVYCPQNPEEEGEVEKFKDEILDRLHVLNMKRAEENN
ncbi:DNA methyltransferase [Lamprobacter modestohalophilus]|uniref:DNA methyltransferase n=1 Tax=Lamprobacter modestohalophilus TaxID=1064514 RepID=UPI002ADEE290|nr:DNA methyltransferase [Lamprobacter modestohalophilus]MEA1052703.1 DNA methyltransferase [Lamprobacter modestohalophilus]